MIKVELVKAGKKSKDLAAFMAVNPSTVSDWCTNTNQPSIQDLFRIAEWLDIEPADLVSRRSSSR